MSRLQHYVEFMYLIVAAMAFVSVLDARRRWTPGPRWTEWVVLAATVAAAPLAFAVVAWEYVRAGRNA